MDSEVANAYLQGGESLAVGIARRRVRFGGAAGAALRYLPALRLICAHYRRIVKRLPPRAGRRRGPLTSPQGGRSDRTMADDVISLNEAARISGVSRVDAEALGRAAGRAGRRGTVDPRPRPPRPASSRGCASAATPSTSFAAPSATAGSRSATSRTCCRRPHRIHTRAEAAELSGLEEELIERIMSLLGTPTALEGTLSEEDAAAMSWIAEVLKAGFPLVAVLQLIRVYAQSIRKIAEAEVRLFHLFVHEPLIRQGVDALEMAEEMEGLVRDLLPLTSPLMEYVHQRYLRFYMEQDVVGHMETELEPGARLGRVQMAFCFVDLTGFTRYTEEEGDEEALDLVERFVETVEATLPRRGADREDDRRRGDDRLARARTADRVGRRLPRRSSRERPQPAGRAPLRQGRLSRRRLLRQRRQPDPPGGRPRSRRRGDGDRGGRRRDRQLRLPRASTRSARST